MKSERERLVSEEHRPSELAGKSNLYKFFHPKEMFMSVFLPRFMSAKATQSPESNTT